MTARIAILRPEPGNAATAARVAAAGFEPLLLPLFEHHPLPWQTPEPATYDALLLTSANAIRHGGPALAALTRLPVLAVGAATAAAATSAGFAVIATGSSDAADLLARHGADRRLLWLAGRERTAIDHPALTTVPVYAAQPLPLAPALAAHLPGAIALLHASSAARRLGAELDRHAIPRASVRIAAISAKVAEAAGTGWADIATAAEPSDAALIAAARRLAIDPRPHRENNGA